MPVKNTVASTSAVLGGAAAVLAQGSIKSLECVEYPELGMEAIWKIEVEDFRRLFLWMIKEMTSSSRYSSRSALREIQTEPWQLLLHRHERPNICYQMVNNK